MITKDQVKEVLRSIEWRDGKVEPVVAGPYRYEIVVVCSASGRQKAVFADGEEHTYFAYVRIVRGSGEWCREGGIIVPVLPNGQILMVVEQRPPRYAFPDQPQQLRCRFGDVPLLKFGPFSSVEFPGGAAEVDGLLSADFLHELTEETGARPEGVIYRKRCPHYQFVSDVASRDFLAVAYLEHMTYTPKTENDGGLFVLALWPDEISRNIRNGVIASTHAALVPWMFYKEIEEARRTSQVDELVEEGYIATGPIRVRK